MVRGDRIHSLRIAKKMTLDELGALVGVGKGTMNKYESGAITNIPSDKIEAIANALEVSPAYLMGWSDSPDANLNNMAVDILADLSPSEYQRAVDFVSGLKASRTK